MIILILTLWDSKDCLVQFRVKLLTNGIVLDQIKLL